MMFLLIVKGMITVKFSRDFIATQGLRSRCNARLVRIQPFIFANFHMKWQMSQGAWLLPDT
jgi:hypothetical protein